MTEFEKTASEMETVTPVENEAANAAPTNENACTTAEADGNVCVEESSPAFDIAEVAEEDEKVANARRFNAMTKEQLRDTLKEILESGNMEAHREVTSIKQAFFNIKSRENMEALSAFVEAGNDPADYSADPDEVENELKDLYTKFKEQRSEFIAAEEQRRALNLEKKQEILTRMEEIAGDIDNVNTKFSEFQQLQQDFKSIKDVTPSAESEVWKQFQNVVERYYDNLKINKELRDFDFKRNLEAKRALIEEARKLETLTDPIAAFRALQGLHDQWRSIGPVAKDIREQLWDDFKQASTIINKRHQDYFEQRKAAEQANEEAKTALCEEIEAIDFSSFKSFSDWNAASEKIIELQKKWKEYGFASKKANNALYSRFRKACDDFFEAKTAFFQRTKDELNSNLEKKIALCEKAEALKELDDVKKATDEIVKLQAEWKSIGSVPRKVSDSIWQRFTTACNYFFDERKRLSKERHREEMENLEKKRSIMAELAALPKDGEYREVMPRIKELQAAWQNAGFVPFKLKDKLYAEYREICDALYEAYNKKESRNRMASFQNRVSELKGDGNKMSRERDRLMRVCEARKTELKTIENNMGFFNIKSSAGNSMVKEMENKIKRIKQDIKELQEKIALLDSEK
ncbi:MAG: DUF349 domain-containing protein [Bacteroidales bacterium]|nr:DUF349 domain-containing protein [Bacteroidales bacterium]MBD5348981.1 DUF349 domain-containing protein [Bacteroides sp.]